MNATQKRKSLYRSVIWRRLDLIALEYFEFRERADAIGLSGTIVMVDDAVPLRVEYQIRCDRSWLTQTVRVALTRGAESRELNLVTDEQHRWWSEGEELAQVAGCADIDISITPSTNTLPIRRLGLRSGESRDVNAAWVKFPELAVEPLRQRYVRTDERRYRYASRGGEFTADIDVDEMGIVVRYPPLWERVAVS
ncbi:MAG: putative glycolipid-binding domain-containing protein [Gemmatimonadota bacterium]|nr:putative glycolipid-binding domain-containing protein [Gemmatimonadota bacterium]